ncbi:MAG TPA: transporter [Thermoanaerobaculia bacterium]|nr:transporter [Thermoanaerobaculia bacterium]
MPTEIVVTRKHLFWALAFVLLLALAASGARAQEPVAPSPINTDRPGILLSSVTVGRGVLQTEWGIPAVTVTDEGGTKIRSTSLFGLVRYGLTKDFELRLDSPVYTETRVTSRGFRFTDHGFGDVEVGAKWHLCDNAGARPSFALIPSVIVPVGEKGFSVERPAYQISAMAEWSFAKDWTAGAFAVYLNGPEDRGRYGQETFAVSLSRTLPSPKWSAYGEAVYVVTGLAGAGDTSLLGGGVKYLVSNDVQLDASFDRGLTSDSPDWLYGFGLSVRF